MTDIYNSEKRSEIMSKVKSKGNISTEIALIKIFKEKKIKGWRRGSLLPGRPDFILPKFKIAIFADGCFWHGHSCKKKSPKLNAAFWENKIAQNRKRDRSVNKSLIKLGWKVVRIWECKIKEKKIPKLLLLAQDK
ncbi:very short patch repair endonuclease [Leptospira kmetyi]|uniref:Very short patch repair endonuclease n=1 Tax=Leptospira kmetyi TaxID=408139 RepID=A0ABX4N8A2_9LEPT|nr:very short patch repair endonuclease [Leptospira kmetyi]PJZ28317.1 very short patch repair endonuclease [Leptospira kmetyi]